jgi:poly(A) polymerase
LITHPPLSVAGADWFNRPSTRAVFRALNRRGQEARAVGGAVRNALMGRAAGDVDFATTATPAEVEAMARSAGLRVVPTGIDHGTVTVIAAGEPFEITTLREDVKTFGRHAEVRFGRDWEADAHRRDFTMNALYASADGNVHDPLGGYGDLRAGRVRFIGEARQRIREDYLRILRFFRFHAEYGTGDHDAGGLHAAILERDGLALLSAERVRAELLRILDARQTVHAIMTMFESGLLVPLLGSAPRVAVFERYCALEAALGLPRDGLMRLAALALFVTEDACRLAQRLRLSNTERRRMCAALTAMPALAQPADVRLAIYRSDNASARDAVLLSWTHAHAAFDDASWRAAYNEACTWAAPHFPVNGSDLMTLGFAKGPALGAALRRLETIWLNSSFQLNREQLLDQAQQSTRTGQDHE